VRAHLTPFPFSSVFWEARPAPFACGLLTILALPSVNASFEMHFVL
jgi:hypothetical protein